ncbi:MAG: methionine--tRNA ligase subunit beta, partial [Ruminococcaceae bacterium]|nr:methionine--tRNA ligase subunit beta [Oscillospiraceae bacterium]
NYITALGYLQEDPAKFEKYWPANVHIIGKDILRFHTIYWPIFLMALDLPLPKQIFGHPWLLSGQDKMSKSKGNVIYADDLVNLFGLDAVRFYLLSQMPYAQDGSITFENVIAEYNTNLANTIGNLVNRTVSMVQKYFDGVIPACGELTEEDRSLREAAAKACEDFCASMDGYHTADAADALVDLARRSNKYIDETAPWVLARDEAGKKRLETVLYHLLESIRYLGVLAGPLMPETSAEILRQINATEISLESLATFGKTVTGDSVADPKPLFARIDEKKKMEEIAALYQVEEAPAEKKEVPAKKEAPAKAEKAAEKKLPEGIITIDEFAKVELRVAQVLTCEPVPKAEKLLKLTLDDGAAGRQVVSGIAKWYAPEDLIGKKIIVVANLAPAKLRGVESQGMILAADVGEDAKVIFVDDAIPVGAKIR